MQTGLYTKENCSFMQMNNLEVPLVLTKALRSQALLITICPLCFRPTDPGHESSSLYCLFILLPSADPVFSVSVFIC